MTRLLMNGNFVENLEANKNNLCSAGVLLSNYAKISFFYDLIFKKNHKNLKHTRHIPNIDHFR